MTDTTKTTNICIRFAFITLLLYAILGEYANAAVLCHQYELKSTDISCGLIENAVNCSNELCEKRLLYQDDVKSFTTFSDCVRACNDKSCVKSSQTTSCGHCCTTSTCGLYYDHSYSSDVSDQTNMVVAHSIFRLEFKCVATLGPFKDFMYKDDDAKTIGLKKKMFKSMSDVINTIPSDNNVNLGCKAKLKFEPMDGGTFRIVTFLIVENSITAYDVDKLVRKTFENIDVNSEFAKVIDVSDDYNTRELTEQFCIEMKENQKGIELHWPHTQATETDVEVHVPCFCGIHFITDQFAVKICETGGSWQNPPDVSRCFMVKTIDYIKSIPGGNVEYISVLTSEYVHERANQKRSLGDKELQEIRFFLGKVTLKSDLLTPPVADNILNVIDGIIEIAPTSLHEKIGLVKTSDKLRKVASNVSRDVKQIDSAYQFSSKNIAMITQKVDVKHIPNKLVAVGRHKKSVRLDLATDDISLGDGFVKVVLPMKGVVGKLSDREKEALSHPSITVYRTPTLFPPLGKFNDLIKEFINSWVVAIGIHGVSVDILDQDVIVEFRHTKNHSFGWLCSRWGMTSSEQKKDWIIAGCRTIKTSHNITKCSYRHVGHYALLSYFHTAQTINSHEPHIFIYIGYGVLAFASIITMPVYLILFYKYGEDNQVLVAEKTCLALLTVSLTFLIGMQNYSFNDPIACKFAAVWYHYTLLVAFAMPVADISNVFSEMMGKVFMSKFSHLMLFAWGFPLLVLGITFVLDGTNSYEWSQFKICWLKPLPFDIFFVAPICLLVMAYFTCFIPVAYKKITLLSIGRDSTTWPETPANFSRIIISLVMLVLLCVTYQLLFFAVSKDYPSYFNPLFLAANSVLGFAVIGFSFIVRTETVDVWRSLFLAIRSCFFGFAN